MYWKRTCCVKLIQTAPTARPPPQRLVQDSSKTFSNKKPQLQSSWSLLWSNADHLNNPPAEASPEEQFTKVVPALQLDGNVGAAHFLCRQSAG